MSLPDTVFIFVLALIIFGPKKLPEIGRQLGRLVGEFRRASNEFKYQIEEELRQVDLYDNKRSSQPAITHPVNDNTDAAPPNLSIDLSPELPALTQGDENPAENFPVGQHPNIDTLDTSEFNTPDMEAYNSSDSGTEAANTEPVTEIVGGMILPEPATPDAIPTIMPAEGSLARTTVPFAAADSTAADLNTPSPQAAAATDDSDTSLSSLETSPAANPHPAPTGVEITHV